MSVRAVSARRCAPARLQVPPRSEPLQPVWWARFADDRELVGFKLLLLGMLLVVAMALEFGL